MYSLFAREIGNHGGNCSKIAPSFPASVQRLERGQEPLPGLVGHGRVDVLEVDPALARRARRLAQVGRQCLDRSGIGGEQAEGLDVEAEPAGVRFRPGGRGLLSWQCVVGGVHLDQRELAGVEPQPLLRRAGLRRIPARLDQRLVRPRRRAYPDLSHTRSLGSAPVPDARTRSRVARPACSSAAERAVAGARRLTLARPGLRCSRGDAPRWSRPRTRDRPDEPSRPRRRPDPIPRPAPSRSRPRVGAGGIGVVPGPPAPPPSSSASTAAWLWLTSLVAVSRVTGPAAARARSRPSAALAPGRASSAI